MKRPWMPLYVADYLADTAHLNAAESGAYLHLIMHYWLNDGLPSDERLLARITKMTPLEWKKARIVIQPLFQDGWKHKRIESELTEAARLSAAGRAGGVASGEARRQRSANGLATVVQRSGNDPPDDKTTNPQALHSPSPSQEGNKQDAAGAAKKYAFEAGIIRLNERDFTNWKTSFSYLDVPAELIGMAKWAGEQGQNWFHAVSGLLTKRNREAKAARDRAKDSGQKSMSGIDGVI